MKPITYFLFCILLLAGSLTINTREAHAQENSYSKVTLVEYSDYQCPACAYYHPIVDSLKNTFGGQLKVVYKDFPLNQHQYAALAARAAEAARNQGKFLEMHNMLFENQQRWAASGNPQPIFIGYARSLDLNIGKFQRDLNSAETQRAVMEEKKEGVQMGVSSTPTFFIDGEKVEQYPSTFEEFKALIESHMN